VLGSRGGGHIVGVTLKRNNRVSDTVAALFGLLAELHDLSYVRVPERSLTTFVGLDDAELGASADETAGCLDNCLAWSRRPHLELLHRYLALCGQNHAPPVRG